nr:hypothetical protein [Tanacetum cinerariifolium]
LLGHQVSNVSNQGRMIADMDADADVVLEEAKEKDETKPSEVQEVVNVVTTTKITTEVVTTANETSTAASTNVTAAKAQVPAVTLGSHAIIERLPNRHTQVTAAPARVTTAPSRRRKGVVIRDLQEESTTSTIILAETKSIDKGKGILDEAIDHVKKKAKEDPAVKRYQGMSYDDIRPIFEAKFNTNVDFLQNTKEQIEEEESRALKRLNETSTEKAAKRKKLDEEVEELKRHLQVVPNEDVYTKATPLARKVPVVDYEIIKQNNKPYYKIIRADGTHQLYVSFLTLLRNFDREDLESLWILVKERFSTTKPKNFFDDFLLVTLGTMFEKPDIHAQIWKNQRSVHGPAKFKGWKLLESCGV